jgi:hypothetical protein
LGAGRGRAWVALPRRDFRRRPRAADEYNRMGERAAQAGIQQGLHDEEFELTEVNGKRTYDLLFGLLDPRWVKFQFQVSTIEQGYHAAACEVSAYPYRQPPCARPTRTPVSVLGGISDSGSRTFT